MFHYYLQKGFSIKELGSLTYSEKIFMLASMEKQLEDEAEEIKKIESAQKVR